MLGMRCGLLLFDAAPFQVASQRVIASLTVLRCIYAVVAPDMNVASVHVAVFVAECDGGWYPAVLIRRLLIEYGELPPDVLFDAFIDRQIEVAVELKLGLLMTCHLVDAGSWIVFPRLVADAAV